MGDILTGGLPSQCMAEEQIIDTSDFLRKSQYLGEFSESSSLPDGSTFNEIAKVRDNLNVYNREEVEDMIDKEHDDMLNTVNSTMASHLEADDPHGSKAYTDAVVKQQSATTSTLINALKTNFESLLNKKLVEYIKNKDFESFKSLTLRDIAAQLDSFYTKSRVYSKDEINSLNALFVKTNGSTPFTKPLEGIDPVLDRHLATKRYVDNAFSHATDFLNNVEFRTWINQRLAAYAKLSDTYNRDTIDNKLENLVDSVVEVAINKALTDILTEHLSAYDPHGDRAYADGKFATKEFISNLTKDDLPNLVELLEKEREELIDSSIKAAEPVWKTSGPVQATVGLVDIYTDFSDKQFTLLGIMDAIFYGKLVQITVPETAGIGDSVDVNIAIHGLTDTILKIVVKLGDTVIAELEASDLDDFGQATIKSNPIYEDTEFTLEVYYYELTGPITDKGITKVGHSVFIGIIPLFETASTINWNRLEELANADPDNNKFYPTTAEDISDLEIRYEFTSPREPKQIFIAVPANYPDLVEMATSSQQFSLEAFNVVNQIPLTRHLANGESISILYRFMVYKLPIVTLSTKVTFKFK